MFPKRVVHTNYELGMLQNVCSIKINFLLLWASHEVPLDLLIELNSVYVLTEIHYSISSMDYFLL